LPPSTLPFAVKACQVAPPVAVDRLIVQKLTLTVPLALDRVWLAAVTLPMVTRLPAVPESENPLVKVVVVAAVKDTVTGWVVLRMSAKVLEPVIVSAG
jgi:hypothetical protein